MFSFQTFIEGYFFGALAAVSLPIGALGLRLLHALTGGKWAGPIEKYYIAASRLMPLALLIWVPVMVWAARIYTWAQPAAVAADPLLMHKAVYLNAGFFSLRAIAYFVLWTFSVWWLDRGERKKNLSGLLSVVYLLSGSFAAIDWVMSLMPHWYSTIFSSLVLNGQLLFAYCFSLMWSGFTAAPNDIALKGETYIDEGNLLMALLIFWAYLAFSQLLIIWMGNEPEEISWYLIHMGNGWKFMAPLMALGQLFVPFFLLLRRSWKANPFFLAMVALLIVLMRFCDMAWSVFSSLGRAVNAVSFLHVFAAAMIFTVYLYVWRSQVHKPGRDA